MEPKNLQLERTVFFCDAVIAIAITLLVLDIRLKDASISHFTFRILLDEWKSFAAFVLSFINIANFWRQHHSIFAQVKKMDNRLLSLNIFWLFFIVILPFSTTVVSRYFFDSQAQLLYISNIFIISLLQNSIWRYVATKPDFMKQEFENNDMTETYRILLQLDIFSTLLAVCIAFFYPPVAFILLFTKLPTMILAVIYMRRKGLIKDRRKRSTDGS